MKHEKIEIRMNVKLSLWSAIKLRLAGLKTVLQFGNFIEKKRVEDGLKKFVKQVLDKDYAKIDVRGNFIFYRSILDSINNLRRDVGLRK